MYYRVKFINTVSIGGEKIYYRDEIYDLSSEEFEQVKEYVEVIKELSEDDLPTIGKRYKRKDLQPE